MTWRDYSVLLLLNGGVKVLIWGSGAVLAAWRRRGLLAFGFGLFCVLSAATPAAGLVVASFIGTQPARAPRPPRWTL